MNLRTNLLWLARGMLIASIGLIVVAGAIAGGRATAYAQGTQRPNILFIMGDDIGWMQPSIYHRGLMVGETRHRAFIEWDLEVPRHLARRVHELYFTPHEEFESRTMWSLSNAFTSAFRELDPIAQIPGDC